jgi:alpha-galactosidase
MLLSAAFASAADNRPQLRGIAPTPEEMYLARRWVAAKFEAPAKDLPVVGQDAAATTDPPFSFVYGGRPSAELLKTWTTERASRELDARRTEHTITYRDLATGLAIRCVAVEYHDFPSVEWTLYFKNAGAADTPLVADIQAVDTTFHRAPDGEFILHHSTGSPCTPNDYQPHATPLGPKATQRIATSGGRSTNSDMPYFNIEWPGQGVIVVLGWPGQWAAEFARDEGTGLRVRGGQELTRFKLHPGEEVRTPLAVAQFWQGDWIRSQNLWRRWMLAHNLPRPGGKPMPTAIMNCTSDFYPGMKSNAADEIKYVAAYVNAGVKLDYWWIDAGWYPCRDDWGNIGTWEPDPARYPNGLKEVADFVHSKGMKLVVWFEPERVAAGTWLAEHHAEWIHGSVLDFGNPQARDWMIEHVDKLITGQGIDLYREDHNLDPLGSWRGADAPDRQGMTEIRHVEGHLAYWDELRRRHPQMPIDTCASGGRRNDLETLRRASPLLRSDYRFEPVGTQGHTYGMALWIPYYGTGVFAGSDYVVRSHWCPWLGIGQPEPRKPGQDWTTYHRQVAQLRKVQDYFSGDYYPLTPYSLDDTVWMAWQFDRPEIGEGVVEAFRRAESPYESARFRLRGLDPDARYVVTDLDSGKSREINGGELVGSGLKVTAEERPRAIVLMYRRAAR